MRPTFRGSSIARKTVKIRALALALGVAVIAAACGSTAGSIPVDALPEEPPAAAAGEYIIGIGDLLRIQVFDEEKMSGAMRVRTDGRISLPFVNDIEAAGKTPAKLAAELETGLKTVVLVPKVTVIVEEQSALNVSVLGEVREPGLKELMRGAGVAQAIAAAGGLTNFAKKDRIFVVRAGDNPVRIHFTYDQLTRAVGRAATFTLRAADVVVVE